jgi:ferric-dicitrate binding protein FerR (iron transport regulator)
VAWHGRRDARLGSAAAELPRPYLESLRADAEAGQRTVSAWLHNKIVPVDQEVARVLAVLEQYRRDPVSRPNPTLAKPDTDTADPGHTFTIPAWVVEARQAAAARQAYERRIREQNQAEQRLSELGSTRHHLIETARAAARAHLARYEQLVGLYGAALLRHQPPQTPTESRRRPPEVMTESWVHGDLPLLTLEMDGELSESYRWFLKEFATRTSARKHPIPVEVPRAG